MISTPLASPLQPILRGILEARRSLGWKVGSLFANGEQGMVYDPSDLSTLFQDSAGTTPVTAVEQPVGLMLDKSNGLVLGPELVVNGDFSNGLTGWLQNASAVGTAIVVGEVLSQTAPHGDYSETKQGNKSVVGRTYKVTFDVVSKGADAVVTIQYGRANLYSGIISALPIGTYTAYATSTHPDGFSISVRTNGVIAIDNVSAKELPGNHASQATAGKRPLLKAGAAQYLDFDIVDDALVATFPAALGSTCTVALAVPGVGASILTGQTIGTTYTISSDICALVITNDALTADETAKLTAYLNKKAGM